jgi:hypothetical protein
MPNIVLYGCTEEVANDITLMIQSAFDGKPYEKDYVITVVQSDVRDCNDTPQPFIRLATTDQPHNAEIIQFLRGFHLDLEVLRLEAFFEKE